MNEVMLVLVSVLTTGLVTGTGAYIVTTRSFMSKKEHNGVCDPRMELVRKDIDFLKAGQKEFKEDIKAIRKDVATLVARGG